MSGRSIGALRSGRDRQYSDYPGVSEHLAVALAWAESPAVRYHLRQEMQRCVFEATREAEDGDG